MFAVIEECAAHAPANELRSSRGHFQSLDLAGGLSADVNDNDIGPVHDLVACILDAAAEVYLFRIEEELRIEEADLLEGFGPDDGVGSGNPIDLSRHQWIGPGAVEAAEETGFRKLSRQAGRDLEIGEDAGKHARRGLPGVVAPDKLPASEAHIELLVHVLDGEAQGICAKEGIGVEQNDVAALSYIEGEIVGGAEAEIDTAAHDPDMREFSLDHFDRAVV